MVIISLDKGNPFSIEMTSSSLKPVANEGTVRRELISMALYIRDAVSDETLKDGLKKIVDKMSGGETDTIIETHKAGNYFIHVLNKKNEKSIKISCD